MQHAVSRADLCSPQSSPDREADPDAVAKLRNLRTFQYENEAGDIAPAAPGQNDNPTDDELDFQLFAPTNVAGDAAQKIRLKSPTPPAEAGLIHPNRRSSYYFAGQPNALKAAQYQAAALSGDRVVEMSKSSCPGAAYSWKILHLPPSGERHSAKTSSQDRFEKLIGRPDEPRKRSRKGKKARIMLRAKLLATRTAAETKEAEEREKRTRRNREKKVKKKLKEKAKKEAGNDDDAAQSVNSEAEDD
ncbi:hypothetical protein KC360_g4172 [Hortaea werneckii]|nr:hypothetical protein KC361_g4803 [Hortaea werneckii]KAI6884527.1 hypothetical protein KC325_g4247 [Hortaea werneckii]KAI6993940.1 hypothetical protein KC359_g4876 [Hortaea werneckii]KAI7142516.1 hypothetical protein KC344_g7125 [Hortaea werneckii]KAI7174646.1 hypothetical protein KC360_g4172 [Hortaea werneckii]